MPIRYVQPGGDRILEFWKRGRGGETKTFVHVPLDWDDGQISVELEEWGTQHFQSSEFVRYGWNDVKDFGNRK
jgi:hypothetical protein